MDLVGLRVRIFFVEHVLIIFLAAIAGSGASTSSITWTSSTILFVVIISTKVFVLLVILNVFFYVISVAQCSPFV